MEEDLSVVSFVIPAKAGIHDETSSFIIPAKAGIHSRSCV